MHARQNSARQYATLVSLNEQNGKKNVFDLITPPVDAPDWCYRDFLCISGNGVRWAFAFTHAHLVKSFQHKLKGTSYNIFRPAKQLGVSLSGSA
jgi:hypothetical protein